LVYFVFQLNTQHTLRSDLFGPGHPASRGGFFGKCRDGARPGGLCASAWTLDWQDRSVSFRCAESDTDAWTGASSCGSFKTVDPVTVCRFGLLPSGERVDHGNSPDNAYSQGGQELNASAGAC